MRRKAFVRKAAVSLRRRRRIPAKNAERRARARARDFGAKAEWIRTQRCSTRSPHARCDSTPPSDPSHTRSRGAGHDRRSLIPQCHVCHVNLHQLGRRTFEGRYGVVLDELAADYERFWQRVPEDAKAVFRERFRERWPDAAEYLED